MQSVNSPDGRCRVMLLMEWCGVVWSGVCVCVLCPWGSILMMVGKRVQVAGTAWRSVSLESGVWSMEFWRFEARGDENVPAVQSQSHQPPPPPPPTDLQLPTNHSNISRASRASHATTVCGTWPIYAALRETARLDLECALIAMHLAVSTCLVRSSRAFFLFCLSCFPPDVSISPWLLFPLRKLNPSRQSHPRIVSTSPQEKERKSAVQRWDGLLRHGGPLTLPGRLPSNSTREQAGGGCLLPILLDRKAHAQIQYLICVPAPNSSARQAQAQGRTVWMTSVGKKSVCAADQCRRSRPEYHLVCGPGLSSPASPVVVLEERKGSVTPGSVCRSFFLFHSVEIREVMRLSTWPSQPACTP